MKRNNKIILGTGIATFFFGFGAAALLNLYLFAIKSPLVLSFRSSLNFISSIFGDGIVLPLVNMLVVWFLLENEKYVNRLRIILGAGIGLLITIYFHVSQGLQGLVNWSMPTPWHWNFLGLWHGIYMLAVTSLLSLYFVVSISVIRKTGKISKYLPVVILGLIVFLILLKLDYT